MFVLFTNVDVQESSDKNVIKNYLSSPLSIRKNKLECLSTITGMGKIINMPITNLAFGKKIYNLGIKI